jgi:glutamate carboxypeptidase
MATTVTHPVLSWLRERQDEMRDLLVRLALVETPSLDRASQRDAFAILAREMERDGFSVRPVRGLDVGDHLYARPERRVKGAPFQILSGHMDTVWPHGTLREMPVRQEGDVLHGPGVFDMKGGLVQIVFALRALAELGIEPPATPVVLVVTDEEIGSVESRRILGFLARGAARAFILEPGFGPEGLLKTERKGVGSFTVTVLGRAAHAGLEPQAGVSAILELTHQVQRLFALNDHARGVTVNVGTIDGGLRPNVIAPLASAIVDVRVPSLDAARELERAIRGLGPVDPDTSVEVEGGFGRLPMEATARNRALYRRATEVAADLGIAIGETAVGGGSDGNITSLHTATLDGLGPVGGGAHRLDEHVVISRMPERAALLALLLAAPLGPVPAP